MFDMTKMTAQLNRVELLASVQTSKIGCIMFLCMMWVQEPFLCFGYAYFTLDGHLKSSEKYLDERLMLFQKNKVIFKNFAKCSWGIWSCYSFRNLMSNVNFHLLRFHWASEADLVVLKNNALFNWILFRGNSNADQIIRKTLKFYVCLILWICVCYVIQQRTGAKTQSFEKKPPQKPPL